MSKKYSTVNVLNCFQQILISILTFLFNFILLKNARNFIDMDKVFTKVQWNAVIIKNLEMFSLNFLKNMIKISQKSWEKSRFNNNTFFEMNEKQWCTPFRNNFIKLKKKLSFSELYDPPIGFLKVTEVHPELSVMARLQWILINIFILRKVL